MVRLSFIVHAGGFSSTLLFLTACSLGWGSSDVVPDAGVDPKGGAALGMVLVNVSTQALSVECPAGGVDIETGIDQNADGLLSADEVTRVVTICDGMNGNAALIDIQSLSEGAECAAGGVRIRSGHDNDQDHVLDEDEIVRSEVFCHGANGHDGLTSLVLIVEVAPGEVCLAGGISLQTGLDVDGDGSLAVEEVRQEAIVCNGVPGAPGADGTNGTSCTVTRDDEAGLTTLVCEDGTRATVRDGENGTPGPAGDAGPTGPTGAAGTSCSASRDDDAGITTLACEDGTSVTISDGLNGADGASCSVFDNGNGSKTLTCGAISVTVLDGAPGPRGDAGPTGATGAAGTSCSASRDEDAGVTTITCEDGTSAVVTDGLDGANGLAGSAGTDGVSSLTRVDSDTTLAPTSRVEVYARLRRSVQAVGPFDVHAPAQTSHFSVPVDLYDSNRVLHPANLYFRHENSTNWEWHFVVDGASQQGGVAGLAIEIAAGTLSFNPDGHLIDVVVTLNDFNPVAAAQPQVLQFDFGDPLAMGGTGLVGTILHDGAFEVASVSPTRPCAGRGTRFLTGLDNGDQGGVPMNGVLEDGEVDDVAYICDGTTGASSPVSRIELVPELGGPICPYGGIQIQSGVDDNGDGALQAEEVDDTAVVCSSLPGVCAVGYHTEVEGGVCLSNSRACTVTNGTGTQTWDGAAWSACLLASCDSKVRGGWNHSGVDIYKGSMTQYAHNAFNASSPDSCMYRRTVAQDSSFKARILRSDIVDIELVHSPVNECGWLDDFQARVSYANGTSELVPVDDGTPVEGNWQYPNFYLLVYPLDGGESTAGPVHNSTTEIPTDCPNP